MKNLKIILVLLLCLDTFRALAAKKNQGGGSSSGGRASSKPEPNKDKELIERQRSTLQAIYRQITKASQVNKAIKSLRSESPKQWFGVIGVNQRLQITAIELEGVGLKGAVTIAGLSELRTLNLSSNEITELRVEDLTNLSTLLIENNQLERIHGSFPNLTFIDLSQNKISELDKTLQKMRKLQYFTAANNALRVAKKSTWDHISRLAAFLVKNNKIEVMVNESFLNQFRKRALIDLRGNPIETMQGLKNRVVTNKRAFVLLNDDSDDSQSKGGGGSGPSQAEGGQATGGSK